MPEISEDHELLAARLLGHPENADYDELNVALLIKYHVDLEEFADLVKALLPFSPPLQSPLSGDPFHTFGYHDGSKTWVALCKSPYKEGK